MGDSRIRYTRSSDHDVGALATPDYSTVATSNKLGTCLCFQNPKEERFYHMRSASIEKQKRRRQVAWLLAQRRFLITQVFEKGLAPSTGRSSPEFSVLDGEAASAASPDQDYYVSVSPCGSPQAELTRSVTLPDIRPKHTDRSPDRALTSGDYRTSGVDPIQKLPPIAGLAPDSATLARSRSLQDFRIFNFQSSAFTNYGYRPVQLAPLVETERENDPSAASGTQDLPSEISPARSRRRNFAQLKKNPENLFPKMRLLIERGPDALEAETRNDDVSNDLINNIKNNDRARVGHVTGEASAGDSAKDNYLKLIQKITAYLPDHLVESAKKQIREMTKSDAIYRQKQKLLLRERERINIEENPKWRELKLTISPKKPILQLIDN